jgi:uncharacterized protein YkwD
MIGSITNNTFGRLAATLTICALFMAGCADTASTAPLQLTAAATIGTEDCSVPDNTDDLRARIVTLVNQERMKLGLSPVVENDVLCQIADDYACHMIQEGYFAHYDPDTGEGPGERAIRGGYFFFKLGENLAAGQRSPDQAMTDWMQSTKGHRENILSPEWEEIGVAVRLGGEHGIYWVQEFGDPH